MHHTTQIDVAGNVRAAMGRANVTASDLSRWFGGAVTYWTRRSKGLLPFDETDLAAVGLACGVHPAELMGGQAPSGWAPEPFDPRATTHGYLHPAQSEWGLAA